MAANQQWFWLLVIIFPTLPSRMVIMCWVDLQKQFNTVKIMYFFCKHPNNAGISTGVVATGVSQQTSSCADTHKNFVFKTLPCFPMCPLPNLFVSLCQLTFLCFVTTGVSHRTSNSEVHILQIRVSAGEVRYVHPVMNFIFYLCYCSESLSLSLHFV